MAPKFLPRGLPRDEFTRQMTPPCDLSISLLGSNVWSMGSDMLCENTGAPVADALSTWKDSDGTWSLRRRTSPLKAITPPPGDSDVNRTYLCGNASAIWLISPNVLCKVKSWIPGLAPEAETIKWVVENCPTIPVPKVIYSWIDEAWQRSFCLMEVAPGVTLDEAWNDLSAETRELIADEVTTYIIDAAQHVSPSICTATGTGIIYHGLILGFHKSETEGMRDWRPHLHNVLLPKQLDQRLLLIGGQKCPEEVTEFVFFHGDIGPPNILVDKDKNDEWHVSSIIDWETAGYFPAWYIRSIIGLDRAYLLNRQTDGEAYAWKEKLFYKLEQRGWGEYCDWLMQCLEYTQKNDIYLSRGESDLVLPTIENCQ
ncbi:MAG: hypothetical protein Q9167_005588 [Letrouitia subvulpina]